MNLIGVVTRGIDKKADGNVGILNGVYKTAMKTIRESCKTNEEFEKKCEELIDSACGCMGEEYREFYRQYMDEMKTSL